MYEGVLLIVPPEGRHKLCRVSRIYAVTGQSIYPDIQGSFWQTEFLKLEDFNNMPRPKA